MREEVANLVHPVLTHGLKLKDRLEQGESPGLEQEQALLKGLLLSDLEARRWADFGGEGVDHSVLAGASRIGDAGRRGGDHFLGIRYALVCWLDEIFTLLDSPWSAQWNEHKLEATLYGTNDRAWKFWEQARRAEARPGTDALEAFFLCVMLGFRGDLRNQPDKLEAWVAATQTRIARGQGQEWPVPPEAGDPPTNVPPRHGREQLQRMILVAGAVLLVVIPVVVFFVMHKLTETQ